MDDRARNATVVLDRGDEEWRKHVVQNGRNRHGDALAAIHLPLRSRMLMSWKCGKPFSLFIMTTFKLDVRGGGSGYMSSIYGKNTFSNKYFS